MFSKGSRAECISHRGPVFPMYFWFICTRWKEVQKLSSAESDKLSSRRKTLPPLILILSQGVERPSALPNSQFSLSALQIQFVAANSKTNKQTKQPPPPPTHPKKTYLGAGGHQKKILSKISDKQFCVHLFG